MNPNGNHKEELLIRLRGVNPLTNTRDFKDMMREVSLLNIYDPSNHDIFEVARNL